ncbi:MAG: hypothetical protein Q8904_13200 [Bacteroidota bacterium]|nr:hypothetical protein [Bacteroidota bacterium]
MPGRFKILLACIILSIFLGINPTNAQLLQDSASMNLIRKNIDCIYNLQFNKAQEIYLKILKSYPGHPVVFLLRGLQTYWKNYPLQATNPAHISFEEDLRQCIRLSEKNKIADYEAEYLLNNLCARGMLLKYYDDNSLTLEVVPLAIGTYSHVRHSFVFTNICTDLQYYRGVYNYYREVYPLVYPIYKPLVLLFPPGNMKTGLTELHNAAMNGLVLRAESYFLLTWIYLNFENKYQQALIYSRSLHELYPDNAAYLALYIKNLLLLKNYNEAEKLVTASLKDTENKYLQAQLIIFKGILLEKKYHDNNQAQQYYNSGLSKISSYGVYGNECAAYACFGLSRISTSKNEKDTGKKYRVKAVKLAPFKKITFDK